MLELTPTLCHYVSAYINEELDRGTTIDQYTIMMCLDAFIGGASLESLNGE